MITIIIIFLTVVFSLCGLYNTNFFHQFQFNAFLIKEKREYHRFLSYGLLHADYFHLFINMFVLWSFGRIIEDNFKILFGEYSVAMYIGLYIGGIIIPAIPSYFKNKSNYYYNAVGASGAVSAVLFASIILFPTSGIMVFPFPFSIPAFIFGVLYIIYSVYMSKKNYDNIGHDVHYYGALFGILYVLTLKPELFLYFINQIQTYLSSIL